MRVYLGRDPDTAKRRYATRTVRGTKREAQSALVTMVSEAERRWGGLDVARERLRS